MMPYNYYEFPMPTKDVEAYYKRNLEGHSELRGFSPAIKLSENLDDFVNCDDNYLSTIEYNGLIADKISGKYGFEVGSDALKRVFLKYAVAMVVSDLRTIEKYQKQLRQNRRVSPSDNMLTNEMWQFKEDPTPIYKNLRSSIDNAHSTFVQIEKWTLDEEFKNTILPKVKHQVSIYYQIFGLDYTPISQKVEDKSISCLGNVGCLFIFIILFWIVATLMSK